MTDKELEKAIETQEKGDIQVESTAVADAKANIEKKKKEEDAREAERRLERAARDKGEALRKLRYSRAEEKIRKDYLSKITEIEAKFSKDGNFKDFDTESKKAADARDKELEDAKRTILWN